MCHLAVRETMACMVLYPGETCSMELSFMLGRNLGNWNAAESRSRERESHDDGVDFILILLILFIVHVMIEAGKQTECGFWQSSSVCSHM